MPRFFNENGERGVWPSRIGFGLPGISSGFRDFLESSVSRVPAGVEGRGGYRILDSAMDMRTGGDMGLHGVACLRGLRIRSGISSGRRMGRPRQRIGDAMVVKRAKPASR